MGWLVLSDCGLVAADLVGCPSVHRHCPVDHRLGVITREEHCGCTTGCQPRITAGDPRFVRDLERASLRPDGDRHRRRHVRLDIRSDRPDIGQSSHEPGAITRRRNGRVTPYGRDFRILDSRSWTSRFASDVFVVSDRLVDT